MRAQRVVAAPETATETETEEAVASSRAAARAAGVEVRELEDAGELAAAEGVLAAVWGEASVRADLMRALRFSGSYVAGAYAGDRVVGTAIGVLGGRPGEGAHLHSHIAGVATGHARRGIGTALKLHQRAWSLQRGLDHVEWTFDPLVARNAWFNLARLGATAEAYLVDFYGEMPDGINAGQGSDRLLARWELRSPAVAARAAHVAAGRRPPEPDVAELLAEGSVLLALGVAGEPRRGAVDADEPGQLLCAVPSDVEALRRRDPGLAREWRLALRDTLAPALSAGRRIAGFVLPGWYVLDEPVPARSAGADQAGRRAGAGRPAGTDTAGGEPVGEDSAEVGTCS